MIVTDDKALTEMCFSLRNQGRGKAGGRLAHERMGYNFRLSDINCALGLVQLSRLDEFVEKRRRVANCYQHQLQKEQRIILPRTPPDCDISWFVFVVRLVANCSGQRDAVLKAMLSHRRNTQPPIRHCLL